MKARTRRSLAAALLAACCATSAHAAITVTDDTGRTVRLAQPARRIVSLAPHITENLFAIGAGERVAGTVDYSDYPEAARKIPRVGGYSRIDLEAVAALKPDLVLAWESGNAMAQVDKLRVLGVPVYVSQPNRIEDVAASLERLGELTGTEEGARAAAARFRARLAELRSRYASRPAVRTFYQVWNRPLMTVGRDQIISDALRVCGGENVFGHLGVMAPAVTVEAVLAANPEAIVASGMGDERPEWLEEWRRWTQMEAVQRDNLFFVPPQLIQRHTPRILDGTERLCAHLETARARRSAR
ncbi:MAG: cobalamin-binding protein [Pseudomonadota bacterium]|jgi:iron complex transport system substrate-binding protein